MKRIFLILALLLVICSLVACEVNKLPEETTEGETPTLPKDGAVIYNVIYSTDPKMALEAAAECISSGNKTYVMVRDGVAFYGIDAVENFVNLGFDVLSEMNYVDKVSYLHESPPYENALYDHGQFTKKAFDLTVKELSAIDKENAFFRFYTQDKHALECALIAHDSGIARESFHVFSYEHDLTWQIKMIASGAYDKYYSKGIFDEAYVNERVLDDSTDGYYDAFCADVENTRAIVEELFAGDDFGYDKLSENEVTSFALAALPNFTYRLCNSESIMTSLRSTRFKSKMLDVFEFANYNGETKYKIRWNEYSSNGSLGSLEGEELDKLLRLFFGEKTEEYSVFAKNGGKKALLYVQETVSSLPRFASMPDYFAGGLEKGEAVPKSYEMLADKYKTEFLFPNEADYLVFLNVLEDALNYEEGISEEIKSQLQVEVFNYYIDYIILYKYTYLLHGSDFDIYVINNTAEASANSSAWETYKLTASDGKEYSYGKLLSAAISAFRKSDSVGKTLKSIKYNIAIRNIDQLPMRVYVGGTASELFGEFPLVTALCTYADTYKDYSGGGINEEMIFAFGAYAKQNGSIDETYFYNKINFLKYICQYYKSKNDKTTSRYYYKILEGYYFSDDFPYDRYPQALHKLVYVDNLGKANMNCSVDDWTY